MGSDASYEEVMLRWGLVGNTVEDMTNRELNPGPPSPTVRRGAIWRVLYECIKDF